jgi:adenylate cyclase class 2
MSRRNQEIEIKLAVHSAPAVRRRLRQIGLRVVSRRAFEENTLFDTSRRSLRRGGQMLRLRRVSAQSWLTFKQRSKPSTRYKVRVEYETEIADASRAERILRGLGYEPVFRYEKFRRVYAAPGRKRGGEVMLDETPIGTFLELEGSRSWIRGLRRRLKAQPGDFITQTYAELYARWCRAHRRPVQHMTFPRRFRA